MTLFKAVFYVNLTLLLLFMAAYAYQAVFVGISLFKKDRPRPVQGEPGRYAVLIPARNEEVVIGSLLDSLAAQSYPKELLDVYVIADNCTDRTAAIARSYPGVDVMERHNTRLVGKSYALDEALPYVKARNTGRAYDGYFVFDADNVAEPDFVAEMDKTFRQGYRAVTCYRNSKNYGSNWLSAGSALWFLRESRFLNGARRKLGCSCTVSGTGFLVSARLLEQEGGWKWHLLTEDVEFSADRIARGEVIGYCPTAMLYDEQPVHLRESWNQRVRWSKGFCQVLEHYGAPLAKGLLHKNGFSCYDMLMTVGPATLLTAGMLLFDSSMLVYAALAGRPGLAAFILLLVGLALAAVYLALFGFGLATTLAEWKRIHCPGYKKLLYLFTFPLFIFSYMPIAVAAMGRKVDWKPIPHSFACSRQDILDAQVK